MKSNWEFLTTEETCEKVNRVTFEVIEKILTTIGDGARALHSIGGIMMMRKAMLEDIIGKKGDSCDGDGA
jgi:hypothetical protein